MAEKTEYNKENIVPIEELYKPFCKLTGIPFEEAQKMGLNQIERKIEKASGKPLKYPEEWHSLDHI
ncbi:MAG: hypothetical protein KKB25_02400 [Nanoarchaeota archaeon]|nr:hypothetical protein [Nanoarchaeota archaeon]